ncbi:MAG: hypothetical protein IBX55_15885 [Methyloprofundus sp.]|nr:hypothetical protein [Methyloprofundus sp.]
MRKLLVLLVPMFFLGGCISDNSDSSPNNTTTTSNSTKINLIGSWNVSGSIDFCPSVTANYTADMQSTDGVNVTQIQRFGGGSANLIDIDTCTPMAFGGDVLDYSFADFPIDSTESDLVRFFKLGYAYHYEINSSYITPTITNFEADTFSFKVVMDDGTDRMVETGTYSR